MTNAISLTKPIATGCRAGTQLPWERPYSTVPIATLVHNGANLFHIDMSPSASTRILTSRIADERATSIRDLDPALLLNRRAAVVRVPEGDDPISSSSLEAALEAAQTESAKALLLVTAAAGINGGSQEPRYLSGEAAGALAGFAQREGIDLVLTDLPYLTAPGGRHVAADWLSAQPWLRPSWPSPNAATYLTYHYPRKHALEDWAPTLKTLEHVLLVLGLANTLDLEGDEVVVSVAPFQVQDVGEAPCTVVAHPVAH